MKNFCFLLCSIALLSLAILAGCGESPPAAADGDAAPDADNAEAETKTPDLIAYEFDSDVREGNVLKYRILSDEAHYYIPDNQIRLFDLHVDTFDEDENVKSTVDAAEGVYYLSDSLYRDKLRSQQDLDLFATDDQPVLLAEKNQILEASHVYYNTVTNMMSSSQPVVQHFKGSSFRFAKGFTYDLNPGGQIQAFGRADTIATPDYIQFPESPEANEDSEASAESDADAEATSATTAPAKPLPPPPPPAVD